jgi:hypothetical protein
MATICAGEECANNDTLANPLGHPPSFEGCKPFDSTGAIAAFKAEELNLTDELLLRLFCLGELGISTRQ